MSVRHVLLVTLAALGCAVASPAATAKTRALLVGVSEYPGFAAEKQLKAPANDVRRMQGALKSRGIAEADLVVLADGVEGTAGSPTRAAILDGMERLAREAEKGDLVIFYASGHGTRQPSRTSLKVDGLDQVFLPRDASPPGEEGPRNRFGNVIAGPDFGERLDAIRTRGADVWFILDSCFSGSASRAIGEGVHDKKIELEDIGLAASTAMAPEKASVLTDMAPALPPGSGRLTAFYASQPNETAREVALPPGAPMDKRVWGSIFTTALTDVLKRAPSLTYRQLIVETGRVLRADAAFQARQTPSFEGDGMDGAVPGTAVAAAGTTWRVSAGVLHAGQIEGVEAGAVVALYDSAAPAAEKPTGYAMVEDVEATRARLAAVKPGCLPTTTRCPTVATSPILKQAAYARLARPAPPAAFSISHPRPWPGAGAPDAAAEARLGKGLEAALAGPLKDRARFDDAAPTLVAWMTADGFRFMPDGLDPLAVEAGPPAVIPPDANPDTAAAAIARAVLRARQLSRLQALASATSTNGGLDVSVDVQRFGLDPATRQCAFKGTATAVGEDALVKLCDKVQISVENRSTRPFLAAIFFLDDGWNMIARRPTCPIGLTVSDRMEPGRRLVFEVPYHPRAIIAGRAPTTTNGVFVMGVPFVEGETDLPALCALTGFNDASGQASRGDETGGLDDLIEGSTRGGRLPLESASLSLVFWPISQPVKP
ncbi:caspase family protein [Xanthobacter oligotrophicus]|uniref:caspase family protein n=1 Tax=Xanthobacter oligotrophicus TaxID=2607286 RepID=UPI00165E8123|nr:caspase family protein [Xanthobacter oligotrophicus]MCG5233725.1 caspase family protein [Xanthobacter oligotrophicus]